MITHIIYLLHSDVGDGRIRHYVGSTQLENFRRRMRAHASGIGTKLTHELYTADAKLLLVRTWHEPSRDREREIHRNTNPATLCPICSPTLFHDGFSVRDPFPLDGAPPKRRASLSF